NVITNQDRVLTSVTTTALAAGATQDFPVDVTIPLQSSSGTAFIGVIADAGAAVTESSETNNTANKQITIVSMPDLIVRDLTANQTTVTPGDTVRVQFTVVNQGSFNA